MGSGVVGGAEAMTEAEADDNPDRLLHILRMTLRAEIGSDQPELSLRQLAILLLVYRTKELQSASALVDHLCIPKSSVTRALDHLQDLDLASRVTNDQDRRRVLVHQTARGAAMVERLGTAMANETVENGAV